MERMMLTRQEQLDRMKLELALLGGELRGFLNGDWSPEFYFTIGYNKVFTGRKRWAYSSDG